MDSLDLNMLDIAGHGDAETFDLNSKTSLKSTSKKVIENTISDSIRSKAVVTYSAAKSPALFSQLAPFTNLNLAPSNWLRSAPGLRPSVILSGSRSSSTHGHNDIPLFTSFQMADSHLNYVGVIDVVSDAENLKKLLKVPYSKAHVSMAVHRIGNTLLLEQFDINHVALEPPGWKWFNDMYKQLSQKVLLKKKLASAQNDRLMLSKFLYYSVNREESFGRSNDTKSSSNIQLETSQEQHTETETIFPLNKPDRNVSAISDSTVIPKDLRWKYWTPEDAGTSQCYDIRNTFERTIFWTFEDLQMLLGTNMPIFGGGEYPAVSLRLMDSNKPINILTGIDYWLDNLICNVPEVVMCFHVNGIVQKYEVIKTEEIPKVTTPKFSPKVIKDIAQNILSFLKSNCTKEGHTYWLFKGSNDDVVKLYDLTSLCSSQNTQKRLKSDAHNPFTISVATLLFKMAVNLMKQQQFAGTSKQTKTIKKLLNNCVKLLEPRALLAPVMLDAALCMLSSLHLPDSTNEVEHFPSTHLRTRTHSTSLSKTEGYIKNCPSQNSSDNAEIAVISCVNDLSIPEKFKTDSNDTKEVYAEVKVDYSVALSFIIKGLEVFNRFSKADHSIPEATTSRELLSVHMQMIRNVTLIYYAMAKRDFAAGYYGKALHCVKVALLSYEYLEKLLDFQLQQTIVKDYDDSNDYILTVLKGSTPPGFNLILPKLLTLCGELQMLQCQWNEEKQLKFQSEYDTNCHGDTSIIIALETNFSGVGEKYNKAINLCTNYETILQSCRFCFDTALDKLNSDSVIVSKTRLSSDTSKHKDTKKETNKVVEDKAALLCSIRRKLGDVANEQGALFLDKAVQLLNSSFADSSAKEEQKLWNISFDHFETALKCFTNAEDSVNQSLVQSNLGRLMRVCAQATAQRKNEEFMLEEQQLYDHAIDYYKKALALQNQTGKNRKKSNNQTVEKHAPTVSDNISWELSVTYFTLAQRLQDHPPLSLKSRDEIEKMILDLLNKSLKCCSEIWKKTDKRSQAVHHCAKIHSRIASLYHNSYRQSTDGTKQRHLKSLSEMQYEKACSFYNALSDSHMSEFLRVLLECLALKEQQLPSVLNPSTKLKLILEGLQIMSQCIRPLKVLLSFLQNYIENVNNSKSTPVDPQSHSNGNYCTGSFKEWKTLVDILCTIYKSFLLSLLKVTAPSSGITKKKSQSYVSNISQEHMHYKQIYRESLQRFQKIETGSISDFELSFSQDLLKKVEVLIDVINHLNLT